MAFSTVQLGRLALTELPQNQATEQLSAQTLASTGRLLHVTGQEAYPLSTAAQMAALHDDLQGMVAGSYMIPVTFGDKSDRNGFYTVYSAQSGLKNWNGSKITDDWQVDLQRIGSPLEIDFESRLTGPNVVNNSFSLSATAVNWNSPPANAYAFYSGQIASTLTRACSDGPSQLVYFISAGNPPTSVRWGCGVADYGNGRARFLDSAGLERSGINFSVTNVASWTLTNGLVRVQPGSSGNTLDVACWAGGAWQTKAWDLSYTGGNMSGWQSANVLRNDYEMTILRLIKDGVGFRVQIDLTLRRGSRFVEIYINVGSPSTISVLRHTAEAGTSATGTVTATSNDAAGNKYTVGSAHTFTANTTTGGLSLAGTSTLDCYIGAVVGGSGATSGDLAADLLNQYAGRRGETVQAVRR